MKVISVDDLSKLIKQHGFDQFLIDLMEYLRRDFSRWQEFTQMPRPAMHVPGGVIELMPVCDHEYYTYKYVTGHPSNPELGKQTVVATAQLSGVKTGYPLMISEMTTLTALRTAASSALASDLLSRKDSRVVAIIGTGAQSEFQIRALKLVRDIQEVRYFDTDPKAMDKFEENMKDLPAKLVRCASAEEAVENADIITVVTACKKHVDVIKNDWVKSGVHINGMGGDCPGKTELEMSILSRSKVVVEYFDQSFIEGEIQRYDSEQQARDAVYAELYEVIRGDKPGRESDEEITLYDSVGIGLQDYSTIRLTYDLANKYKIGGDIELIPPIEDPKNLIQILGL